MDLKITPSGQTIVKPTALGPGANTDTKLLIYGLFQKGRVLAQDGVLLPTVYEDGGISGGTLERPGLQRLLADIDAGLAKQVVIYKVDRLTRCLADFAKLAHAASGDIDDKQDMVADEPERVHNLDGEQVCRSDGAPMSLDEGAPRHALAPLRRRSDTVVGEDPLDSVASEFTS